MHYEVRFDKIQKELRKLPRHIVRNLQMWAEQVEMIGLQQVRKVPGYHDELLYGKRRGQRSIRLSKYYRAFYRTDRSGQLILVDIIEVNKHDY